MAVVVRLDMVGPGAAPRNSSLSRCVGSRPAGKRSDEGLKSERDSPFSLVDRSKPRLLTKTRPNASDDANISSCSYSLLLRIEEKTTEE